MPLLAGIVFAGCPTTVTIPPGSDAADGSSVAFDGSADRLQQGDAAPGDHSSREAGLPDNPGQERDLPDHLANDQGSRDGGRGADVLSHDRATSDHAVTDLATPDREQAERGRPDQLQCAPVVTPTQPSADSLDPYSASGEAEVTTRNGFTDDYLYDSTRYIKIGTRREWGGSIVFFGLVGTSGAGTNGTNVIDANDTGREVQVALYDPDRAMQNCAGAAVCRTTPTTCAGGITFLGWDPVQGGNRCNNGSGVESSSVDQGVATTSTLPLHWNPNWDFATCDSSGCSDNTLKMRRSDVRLVQQLRFVTSHIVALDYTVTNLADLDHAATEQEMPTLYSANGNGGPDLWRLFDSEQHEIAIDQAAGGPDGFMHKEFDSPGGWVALQNSTADYGVAILYENGTRGFQGWQLRSLPFNNVRARFVFGLPARGTVHARAYLTIGSLATVASAASWLQTHLAPFGYLDQPSADASVTTSLHADGWALDNRGVTRVEALVDGVAVGDLPYGGARADVPLVWPGYPGGNAVGFGGDVDVSSLSPCQHLLEIRAHDGDGNGRVIARRRFVVR